jgi:hypothetical protein
LPLLLLLLLLLPLQCYIAYAVSTKSHYAINLSLGAVDSIADDQFYQDAFRQFCNADGIALIAAGNGETVNGQDRAVDVANAGNDQDGTEAEYPGGRILLCA